MECYGIATSPRVQGEGCPPTPGSGRTLAQVAHDLGITEETLRRWKRQAEVDAGQAEGLTTAEREELNRLRRENRVLREERDILKKAAAYLAWEATGSR